MKEEMTCVCLLSEQNLGIKDEDKEKVSIF